VPVDDAPTVSATGSNPTFTEDGSAVSLFSGAAVSAIEAAQNIKSLTFTVNNVVDGSAERITVDGSTINLVNGSGTTSTNGMTYRCLYRVVLQRSHSLKQPVLLQVA
jgi:hypothetical protein